MSTDSQHPKKKRINQSTETKEMACVRYLDGEDGATIAKSMGVGKTDIYKWLRSHSILPRSNSESNRHTPINDSAFSTITEESAYWAGFFMADGCLIDSHMGKAIKKFEMGLASVDVNHLVKLSKFIRPEHTPIFRHQRHINPSGSIGSHVTIAFNSEKIFDDLVNLGITPRKSYTAKASECICMNRDFWRGVIDGDGSVYWSKNNPDYYAPTICLIGSHNLMNQFSSFIFHHFPDTRKPSVIAQRNISRVRVTGKRASQLANILYGNSTIYLDRKHKSAMEMIAEAGKPRLH